MPKPSTYGANVLAFKIDGVVHVYSGTPSIGNKQTGVGAYYPFYYSQFNQRAVQINATDRSGYNDEFYLHIMYDTITRFPETGKSYYLRNVYQPASRYIVGGGNAFYVDTATSFVVFTRADSFVVSGRFEFHGTRTDGTKVSLTEGLFDIARKL